VIDASDVPAYDWSVNVSSRIAMTVLFVAALLLAPVPTAVNVAQTLAAAATDGSPACIADCCGVVHSQLCCATSSGSSTGDAATSQIPCGSCPDGGCDCNCCISPVLLVLGQTHHSASVPDSLLTGSVELPGNAFSPRTDEPALPPPIG
jgi:hypothetical protein